MAARAGKTSVPQIWFDVEHIGGCDDLHELYESGNLFETLAKSFWPLFFLRGYFFQGLEL